MPQVAGRRSQTSIALLVCWSASWVWAADAPQLVIQQQLQRSWQEQGILPAEPAADGTWCRRVFLDVIGRTPTLAELESFLRDRSPQKRERLVDRLLGPEYERPFADHWATVWTNLLIGRTGGSQRRDLTYRPGLIEFFRDSFLNNRSYTEIAEALITATGHTRPLTEDGASGSDLRYNPATNFLVGKFAEGATQATTKTAQVFLGLQVQCTQCHNHPFNEWKQNQFWELNAFFRQTRPLRDFEDRELVNVRLVDEGFEGNGVRRDASDAKVFYELRNGQLRAAYPAFVDGTSLVDLYGEERGKSGYLEDINRRQELARLVVASELFDFAIVNRYWAHFHGYGFTKPLDDMGPHNPPSHPDLLSHLATTFRQQNRQLKPLVRWIALSPSYGLSSQATRQNTQDDPALGSRPMFSRFYLRQMRPEALYASLRLAAEANSAISDAEQVEKDRWIAQFVRASGNDEGGESTTFNGSISQTLMLMNGPLVQRACESGAGTFLHELSADRKLNFQAKVRRLYLARLARQPDRGEVRAATRILRNRGGDVATALEDIHWVLLNSNEFILTH